MSSPKTPPSTPFLEKGVPPRSTSKRSKPGLYYAHEITAYKRYTRFLHAVIVLLLIALAIIGLRKSSDGSGEGRLGFMNRWMGSRAMTIGQNGGEKVMAMGVEKVAGTMEDGTGDAVVLAVQQSSSMGSGEREAWREIKDGLEGLWRGLIESECKCHNPELLDRMYEGLRDRAGEMVGGREVDGREVLEG